MKSKKSWREKLDDAKGLPKVEVIEGKLSKRWGTGTVAIPAPREVDELMRKVPKGKVATINEIRKGDRAQARRHDRLPDHHGHLRVDRRWRGGRRRGRRQEAHHAVLAHAEIRRRVESQISGRGERTESPSAGRGTHGDCERQTGFGPRLRKVARGFW